MSVDKGVDAAESLAVFVDDSDAYLNALRRFFPDPLSDRFFTCPRTALKFIQSYARAELNVDGTNASDRAMSLAIVVVDCNMPELSGMDFLLALDRVSCTKVMLTGVADERIAEQALESGLVDFYLRKSDMDFIGKLKVIVGRARMANARSSMNAGNS